MKIILPIFIPLDKLPPAISILKVLEDIEEIDHEVHVIIPFDNGDYSKLFKLNKIKWHSLFNYDWYNELKHKNIFSKVFTREIQLTNKFYKLLDEIYDSQSIIWIIHEETALYLNNKMLNYNYIISIYELNREIYKYKYFKSSIKKITKNAINVIVPEYSRAHILKAWWNLNKLPLVLPNKPYPFIYNRLSNIENEKVHTIINSLKGLKIILYQGAVGYDRKLDTFIEAVNRLGKNYVMVILGQDNEYLIQLNKKYKNQFIHINSVPAPLHLQITSHAHIGILTYVPNKDIQRYEPLNAIFCAPNKIYEFGGFGIPMISNNVPGLINTIEKYNAGMCVNIDDVDEIVEGIKHIEASYNNISNNAKKLFDDCDVINIAKNIITNSLNHIS